MKAKLKFVLCAVCMLLIGTVSAHSKCPDPQDPLCSDNGSYSHLPVPAPLPAPASEPGEIASPKAYDPATEYKTHARPPARDGAPLQPVREYLGEADIPPAGVGAYGIVVLKARPTSATRAKLTMICNSFQAHFDRNEMIPSSVPMSDRMITIWPVDNPAAPEVKADDCNYVLDHYVLHVADLARADAEDQNVTFEGEGPYLVGWSPADTRGMPDKLVLVIDFTRANDQPTIDHNFDFWKDKIVRDPSLWRQGFSLAGMRQSIKDFADHYGSEIIDAVKMAGL
jgi:hypothetical protein